MPGHRGRGLAVAYRAPHQGNTEDRAAMGRQVQTRSEAQYMVTAWYDRCSVALAEEVAHRRMQATVATGVAAEGQSSSRRLARSR
jgi:hypothetical protein